MTRSAKMKKCKQDSDLNIVSMPVVGRVISESVMNPTPEQRISAVGGYRLREVELSLLVLSSSSFFLWKATADPSKFSLYTFFQAV